MSERRSVRTTNLVIPVVAVAGMVLNGVYVHQLPGVLFWSFAAVLFGVLLGWQSIVRRTYAVSLESEIGSEQIATMRPYSIMFSVLFFGFLLALIAISYFRLECQYLIACFAAWLIRRDVWIALLMLGLRQNRSLLSSQK